MNDINICIYIIGCKCMSRACIQVSRLTISAGLLGRKVHFVKDSTR